MSDMDKIYNLLEKVYVELQDTKSEVKNNSQRLDLLETGQMKIETTLENDIKANLQSLHERAGGNAAKLEEHTQRLEAIENKIDILALSVNSQDKRLEIIETSRQKKVR